MERLEGAGHETWCVGGAIRDALLGGSAADVDLATAATPEVVRSLFRRTIPIGIEHGTVGVLDDAGVLHEVTTFRRDVETDGRHAVVAFGASLEEDLARRDFTINAIAYHPLRDAWCDPFDGRGDLEARIVRAVGDPAQRFREDRLRILRALRFAARLGFAIDPPTWEAALAQADDIAHLSAERVREEWVKGLRSAADLAALAALWRDSGVARTWLPELLAGPPATWPAVPPGERDPVLLTAHACTPSAPAWRRFKGSTAEIRRAEAIDRGPAVPPSGAPRDVRHWMAAVGGAADDLATLARWRGDGSWGDEVAAIRARGEATSRGELAVTGTDLIGAAIVPPGPRLGELLDALLTLVLDDPARNTRDALLTAARQLARR